MTPSPFVIDPSRMRNAKSGLVPAQQRSNAATRDQSLALDEGILKCMMRDRRKIPLGGAVKSHATAVRVSLEPTPTSPILIAATPSAHYRYQHTIKWR